jgi:hypothetical protein
MIQVCVFFFYNVNHYFLDIMYLSVGKTMININNYVQIKQILQITFPLAN